MFSLDDIRMLDSTFFRARLNEWQHKGYIKKIVKGYYIFSDLELNENVLFEIANRIYAPSYVSLEMAFSYCRLIPEGVHEITSISTRRTYRFTTPIAEFSYRTMRSHFFFGYDLVKFNDRCFKMACMEKAILDYLYLNPDIDTEPDFISLRINKESFLEQIDEGKLDELLDRFAHKALLRRANSFMQFMKNA
jgi:predicted transcriptional regulator of viral defense system